MAATTSSLPSDARGPRALERALIAARTAAEQRGRDIVILDLRELTTEFDYFVLVTGTSRRQMNAICDEIEQVFKHQLHDRRLGTEGGSDSRWILVDFGDVVVHLFDAEARSYYALDDLWSRAKQVPFEVSTEPGER